jgi:hypothetical protein
MAGVTAHKDSVVEGVLISNALTDRIHRVPFNPFPIDCIGLENLLGGQLHFFYGRRFARVKIWVS